mgnify:CR=1 FL=1
MLQDVSHMQRNHALLGLPQRYLSGLPWRGEIKRANRAQHLTNGAGNGWASTTLFPAGY